MKRILAFLSAVCMLFAVCVDASSSAAESHGAPRGPEGASPVSALEEILLYPAFLILPLGQRLTIDAVAPTGVTLAWTSSDTSVATVDGNGRITPIAEGETIITVTAADDPGIWGACGVRIAADGDVYMWDDDESDSPDWDWDATDDMDMEALEEAFWALFDIDGEEPAIAGEAPIVGIEWPDHWPADLPKMDGTVTATMGSVNDSSGLMVFVTVEDLDTVKAYVKELVSLKLKKRTESEQGDSYIAMLNGKGYKAVTIAYSDSTRQCSITVMK